VLEWLTVKDHDGYTVAGLAEGCSRLAPLNTFYTMQLPEIV